MSRTMKVVYARQHGGQLFRTTMSEADLHQVLSTQTYRGQPIHWILWAAGNMDFGLGHPRIPKSKLLELWYRAPVEAVNDTLVNLST